jgi:aminoglycoside phosphotransferase (APT) family kinase protein
MTSDPATPDGPGTWRRFEPPLLAAGGDLDRLVERAFPGARAVRVEYLDRGVVNSNYQVELRMPGSDAGPSPVFLHLRLSRSDEGPLREGAVLEAARGVLAAGVPRLLGSEFRTTPEPHRISLFTWVPGEPLEELLALPDERLLDLAGELGRELVRLHSVRCGAFGALDTGLRVKAAAGAASPAPRWADDLARRTAVRLENPAHGLDSRRHDEVRVAFARGLSKLWTATIPSALVHGDLSAGNILILPSRGGAPALSGLVDWEMARAADPAHDIASLRFELAGRPAFVARVEEAYRSETAAAAWTSPQALWEERIRLAGVPLALDARMVAVRRRNAAVLCHVDRYLDACLGGVEDGEEA